jgi:hypothetical protein
MANPYEVAIHLTANNGVSSVLAGISKEVLGLNAGVERLQKGFSNLHLGIVGAASALAGAGILKGMEGLVNKGNDWVKVSRDMAQAGASHEQVMRAQAEAMKLTGQYANMSSVEILKMQNDARMTFGDQDKATEHIKDFVQMASFLKSYEGHEKGSADSESLMREINAAMKSGEIAGKITPEAMHEHIMQLTAMKVAYGEQVKIGAYLSAQRTGGVALRNTSDEFRYGMFPALVQEQGSSAGVMLMTAFNKVVAGVGNRTQSLQEMERIGLLNHDQVKYDKVGRAIGLKDPDGMKGSQDAAMNFGSWVMSTLKPLLEKDLDKQGITDPQQRNIREAQEISKMFPDRNAAKAVTEILQQFTKLSKDAEQMARARKALNMDEYNAGSWDYQVEAFQTQWKNLMTHLGAPVVASATAMLAGLNEALAGMSQWAMVNPGTVKAVVGAIAGLGAALLALGTIAVGAAVIGAVGIGGVVAAALVGIGVAVVAFKTQIVSAWNSFKASLPTASDAVHAMQAVGTAMSNAIAAIPGMVTGAISGMASAIGSAISAALAAIPGMIKGAIKGAIGAGTPSGGVGDGGEDMGANVKKPEKHSSYVPPHAANSNTRTASVYLDGRKVGKIIEHGIGSNNRTVTASNGFDSAAHWAPPDVG